MNIQLHPIQHHILHQLLLNPQLRFRDLNTNQIPTDQFSFHLRRLQELNLINKHTSHYTLTLTGKDYVDHIDTQTHQLEPQGKLTVAVICKREKSRGVQYLIQQRLKHPYYGYYGSVSGKIRKGETPHQAASRELLEETGLQANIELKGIKHKRDYHHQTKDLLADKYFFCFLATNVSGQLIPEFDEGQNQWLTEEAIFKLPNLFEDMPDLFRIIKSPEFSYTELSYNVTGY